MPNHSYFVPLHIQYKQLYPTWKWLELHCDVEIGVVFVHHGCASEEEEPINVNRERDRTTECLWSTGTLELIHRLFLAVKVPNPSSLYLATFVFPPFLYFVPFLRLTIMTIEQIQTLELRCPSSIIFIVFTMAIYGTYISSIYTYLSCSMFVLIVAIHF